MLLKLIHTTDLTYDDLISESVMELRMAPRQEMDQHRLSFDLAIGPQTQVTSYFDWLGNNVHAFSVSRFHSRIQIQATSVVETDRAPREPSTFEDWWPYKTDQLPYDLYDYLAFGGPVIDCSALHEVVKELHPEVGERAGRIGMRLLNLIDQKFTYQKGITHAASPITDILTHGKGVCQDFTHLFIALARAIKIPARYVSGLVHANTGTTESTQYRGFSQTHAWAELFFPSVGWIGFDPANRCIVGNNFVKVAIGRDFRDVPPNKGLYRGKATETIDVQVQSEVLPQIPSELVSERYRRIEIPSYTDTTTAHREFIAQQQQIQQQQ